MYMKLKQCYIIRNTNWKKIKKINEYSKSLDGVHGNIRTST